MVRPKHSFKKKKYHVEESFIDREIAKRLYLDKCSSNDKEYNIISFYGVGGVGKSTLRKELCRMHVENDDKSIYMYLDLNPSENRNLEKGILNLVDSCSAKVDFKTFELAYAIYYKKKYPNEDYSREKDLISENSIVNIGLNILGILDNGITAVTAEIIERASRKFISSRTEDDVKETLKSFADSTTDEIEEMLPLFFSYDLGQFLKKNPKSKILIVFDTFEALNENVLDEVHRSRNERWVQDIISYFPSEQFNNLLVLIFGRDKLIWPDWEGLIDQYQLTEFDDDYSKEYLRRVGISSDEIIDAILVSSRGLPLILYLMSETYVNMKNDGQEPTASDFNGDYPRIVERFLYNLDKDVISVLRILSVANSYDANLFKELIREYNIHFSATDFEQLNRYSFVTKSDADNRYYIHSIVRDEVLKQAHGDLIRDVHISIRKYYQSVVKEQFDKRSFIDMFYHAQSTLNIAEFIDWLFKDDLGTKNRTKPIDIIYQVQKRGDGSSLIQVIGALIKKYTLEALPIELVNVYIDIMHLGGNYDTAVNICIDYLENVPLEKRISDEQCIKMSVRQIHHSMFYKPVDPLIADAKELIINTKAEDYPEIYNELLFLIGGNLGILSGNFEEAEKWLNTSMTYAKEYTLNDFIHRTTRKIVDLLIYSGRCEDAIAMIEEYIPDESNIDSRYKMYLMGSKGEVYRKLGLYDDAYSCFEIVDKFSTEASLLGWKSHALIGKGVIQAERKNYDEAEDLFNSAYDIYSNLNHVWGLINTDTLRLLTQLKQGNGLDQERYDNTFARASDMEYQYNISVLNSLMTQEPEYLQLFFL